MPLVDVKFDMRELQRELDRYRVKANSVDMATVATVLQTAIDDEIQSAGQGRWPPFAPATLRRWPRRRGGQLLQKTGMLANIQTATGENWAEAWSPADYGRFHVTGTRNMPRRNYLDINMGRVLEELAYVIAEEIAG